MEKVYNVYKIDTTYGYHGFALVGAETAEEANRLIRDFQVDDTDDWFNTTGYLEVKEYNKIDGIFSRTKGFIATEIYRDEEWSWNTN